MPLCEVACTTDRAVVLYSSIATIITVASKIIFSFGEKLTKTLARFFMIIKIENKTSDIKSKMSWHPQMEVYSLHECRGLRVFL